MFYFYLFSVISCLPKQPTETPCAEYQKELEHLQKELEKEKQEKQETQLELLDVLGELKEQLKLNEAVKQQAAENLWLAFQAQAKVEGCDTTEH